MASLHDKMQKNIGSLMVVQLCSLNWQTPDLLLPLGNKKEVSHVAKQMSSFLSVETKPLLSRKRFVLESKGLKKRESFRLKKDVSISGKTCLVVSLYRLQEKEQFKISALLCEAAAHKVCFLSFLS